ncbi:MAG: hypothetical protein II667_02960 [Clostridiales bacterium]|nr:hypothetical protein [Clostridiales bacterium]MBQ4190648.1 hypothetical protein [Clostridiales bacterium]MBQ4217040.1 hypothetical protein [Clostridiales bacterium]
MNKAKGDLKLLITGVVSLILAIVFSIITVAAFALQLAQKAGETDWNAMWAQVQSGIENVVDDVDVNVELE